MRRASYFLLIPILVLLSEIVNGQLTSDLHKLYNPSNFYRSAVDTSAFTPVRQMAMPKPIYSLELGTSYSTFGGGLNSSFISPSVAFMPSSKLLIVAGGKFSHTNMGSLPILRDGIRNDGSTQLNGSGNPTEAFAYGKYQINERFSIFGMGSFGANQLYYSPFSSKVSTADYTQLSFGMDYKISDKVSIGASFGVTNGPAFGFSPFNSGFGNGRMNPFFP